MDRFGHVLVWKELQFGMLEIEIIPRLQPIQATYVQFGTPRAMLGSVPSFHMPQCRIYPAKETTMPCQQIAQVVNLLAKHDIHPSSSDVVSIVCSCCDANDACPSRRDEDVENVQTLGAFVPNSSAGVQIRTH